MATSDDSVDNARGVLGGHGVGIAMAAIFVGVGLSVVFVASDGSIFGANFRSATGSSSPVKNNFETGNADFISGDIFDTSPSGSNNNTAESSSSPTVNSIPISENHTNSNNNIVDDTPQDFSKQEPVESVTLSHSDSSTKNIHYNRDNHDNATQTSRVHNDT